MGSTYNATLKTYKEQAIDIAKDLCYSQTVTDKIQEAKTVFEIDRIMRDARHGKY